MSAVSGHTVVTVARERRLVERKRNIVKVFSLVLVLSNVLDTMDYSGTSKQQCWEEEYSVSISESKLAY